MHRPAKYTLTYIRYKTKQKENANMNINKKHIENKQLSPENTQKHQQNHIRQNKLIKTTTPKTQATAYTRPPK